MVQGLITGKGWPNALLGGAAGRNFIDDNAITSWIDDNGVTSFTDDLGH